METSNEMASPTEEKAKPGILKNPWVRAGGLIALVVIIVAGVLYWQSTTTRVGIDDSMVMAPEIDLSPSMAGQLQETYVNEGDIVSANAPLAKVGDEVLRAKVAGEVISVDKETGKTFGPGQAVITMIQPSQLRIVGTIDENKGLDKIHVGQLATFTVDAFGSKTYNGVVDEVSPTSRQTGVAFSISDARPTQQFDIKVRFNSDTYSELRNGMSAKLTIFTK